MNSDFKNSILNQYYYKPIILDAKTAVQEGSVVFSNKRTISLNLNNQRLEISQNNYFDLVLPTIFGLNEALVQAEEGGFLRKKFEEEFEKFNTIYDQDGDIKNYGNFVFFPDRMHIVHFAPEYWHKLSLVASNALLFRDPIGQFSWEDVRNIFSQSSPAIAGASVGSKVADCLLKVLRPNEIIIADPAVYKLTNANRTDIYYDDIVYSLEAQDVLSESGEFIPYGMKNKATSFALKSQRIDPYLKAYPLTRGITSGNVTQFVESGNIIVEEVDMSFDMEIKVEIRNEARKQKKLFIMVSDLGSWIQWDIRPFNLNPNIPLFINCSDEKIYSLNREARNSKNNFFNFMEGLIDKHFWKSGEFGDTLSGKLPKVVGSMPQLGSTTSVAGGIAAEFIARILLGHRDIFEQGVVDLRKQEIRTFGKIIGELC